MKIIKAPNYYELNAAQLVSRIKFECLGDNPQELYGRYVIYRGLKPDIDSSEFVRLYNLVVPKSYNVEYIVDFVPTHRTYGGVKVMVIPNTQRSGDVVDIILEYGSHGTDRLKNLITLDIDEPTF